MFVKFLEHESLANKPTARLPAASMAHEAQLKMSQRKLASEGGWQFVAGVEHP